MKEINFNPQGLGVQCLLHTLCNLNCKFCFETKEKGIRHNNTINIDYIKQLPDEVINVINPIIKDNDIKFFSLYLMGGELFSDNISDDMFNVYREFCYNIQNKINNDISKIEFKLNKESNKEINFDIESKLVVVSNGIFKNYKRVENFLKEFNIRLILSYDPVDRFSNDKQKEIWYNTFKYFKEAGVQIALSTLLTKKNMNAYINGDELFDKIPPNIFIDSNIYVPRLDYHDYLPNDDDIFNFYKWCIDNQKFNVSDINSILTHTHICQQEFYYAFSEISGMNYISDCLEGLPFDKKEYYGKYANEIKDDTDCLRYKQPLGLQKRGCLLCEHYMNCSEMCWTQILFDKYEITECPIKRIYEYIDNDPSIMDRFKDWRNKYEQSWKQNSSKSK